MLPQWLGSGRCNVPLDAWVRCTGAWVVCGQRIGREQADLQSPGGQAAPDQRRAHGTPTRLLQLLQVRISGAGVQVDVDHTGWACVDDTCQSIEGAAALWQEAGAARCEAQGRLFEQAGKPILA